MEKLSFLTLFKNPNNGKSAWVNGSTNVIEYEQETLGERLKELMYDFIKKEPKLESFEIEHIFVFANTNIKQAYNSNIATIYELS